MRAVEPSSLPSVLAMIESSAKARGDLGVANDAHYESLVIASRNYSWPIRVLDFVFYRTFAGYLVRPFQPLLALLALAAVVTAFQLARSGPTPSVPGRSGVRAAPGRCLPRRSRQFRGSATRTSRRCR